MYKDYKFKVDELLKDGKAKLVEVTKSDDGKQEGKEINVNDINGEGYQILKLMLEDIIIIYGIKK